MKIRITENTLRCRLSETDVTSLKNNESLLVALPVGPNRMVFELSDAWEISNGDALAASIADPAENEPHITNPMDAMKVTLEPNHLKICIHPSALQTWLNSKEMAIKIHIKHPNNHTLTVVVEKDMMG
jgi:hypothetical protein